MLTERQSQILELIIGDYVESAEPVGSKHLSKTRQLGVSPATVRHEMSQLEEQGYLSQPHTSSGRVPTDKGYRFYVEWLMREEQLPWEAQQTIRHQFHQVGGGQEARLHLAASILAQAAQNAAVVTAPRTDACRIKHLELVSLHDRSALLVLVLDQARLHQQVLELDEMAGQETLSAAAQRLNGMFAGDTVAELQAKATRLSALEQFVLDQVDAIMRAVDEGGLDEAVLEGLRNVLSQPEFADSARALALLELLDERNVARVIPLRSLAREGVNVIIGADNARLAEAGDAMRDFSVVVGAYGAPGASGVLAVLGPTRMRYARNVPTVRYLAQVMSELLDEL